MGWHEPRSSISVPRDAKRDPFPGRFEAGERRCLKRLRATGSVDALNRLIEHYRRYGREELVRRTLEELIGDTDSLEARAIAYVYLGGSHEWTGDWETAIDAYRGALSLEPSGDWTAYFTHNSIGRCLCELGRHTEAERHCRLAISVDPARPDAHRNLGDSLYGQGDVGGAARAWVDAIRANAADDRSLELVEGLVHRRPEPMDEPPRLNVRLEERRRAALLARETYDEGRGPAARAAGVGACRVCGERGVTMEAFGGPIDDCGRSRALLVCAGCGTQSVATYLQVDLAGRDPEARPAVSSPDRLTPGAPRLVPMLGDLLWLSMVGLAIAHIAGLLDLFDAWPEAWLGSADLWPLGLRAALVLGLTAALRPIRETGRRVWRAFSGWRRAVGERPAVGSSSAEGSTGG